MQNWDGCNELGMEETITLRDIRDDNDYTIAKLKDGKCWMVQNLRLSGPRTIYPTDSDISSNYTFPNMGVSASGNDYYIEPTYGGIYSRPVATANNAGNSSICPKGWRLPMGGYSGEFAKVVSAYGSVDALRKTPVPGFEFSGYNNCGNSISCNVGTVGSWWSKSASDNMKMRSTGVTYDNDGWGGLSVRCILEN